MFSFPSKIYPITDIEISGLSHTEQVERLIAGGATLIQLRDKHSSPREFFADAQAALALAHSSGVRIIINDRADIAFALKADGVHLGQADIPPTAARELLGSTALIGFSVHSVEQARLAADMPVDYLGIGPVFPTSTKDNPDQVIGLKGLRRVREFVGDARLVAIGGIGAKDIHAVLDSGANAVALINALLQNPSQITTRMRELVLLSTAR